MGNMAEQIAARIAADGGLEGGAPDDGAAAAPGTGNGEAAVEQPAGAENTETRSGPPETIPYSRFQEVNSQLQELKDYAQLSELGIEPDSAVRLANFEAAYVSDPKGIISTLIESQPDLTDEAKVAMKSLLAQEPSAGAQGDGESGEDVQLPKDVQEKLAYVDTIRERDAQAESTARLNTVVRHWDDQDKADEVEVPERTKLVWIQAAAGSGDFKSLNELADAARKMYFEDRDVALGSVVQTSRGTGTPRTVPGAAAGPTPPTEFKDFGAANRQILADIREGRLPGIEQEG